MSEFLKVSGKKFALPAAGDWTFQVRPGGWIIARSSQGEHVRFAACQVRGKFGAAIGGKLYFGEIQSEQRGTSSSAGLDDLIAQFPGKVRKVLVSAGDEVAALAPLLLVEAMKMEFTVKAPCAGRIKAVLVKEGQQLSPGDRFFDMEVQSPHG